MLLLPFLLPSSLLPSPDFPEDQRRARKMCLQIYLPPPFLLLLLSFFEALLPLREIKGQREWEKREAHRVLMEENDDSGPLDQI